MLIRARWVDHFELQIPHEVAEHAPRAISLLRLLRELWPSIPQPVCIHRGCNSIPVLPQSGGSTWRTVSVREFSRGDLLSESSPSPGMRHGNKSHTRRGSPPCQSNSRRSVRRPDTFRKTVVCYPKTDAAVSPRPVLSELSILCGACY